MCKITDNIKLKTRIGSRVISNIYWIQTEDLNKILNLRGSPQLNNLTEYKVNTIEFNFFNGEDPEETQE